MSTPVRLDHTDLPSGDFKEMPEGLEGYWWETERQVCIPWVASRGPRAFLRFLREQEAKGKAVVFPTVVSGRLTRLLALRGYVMAYVYVDYAQEDTDVLVLRPECVALASQAVMGASNVR